MVDDFDPHISYEHIERSKDLPGYVIREISLDSNLPHRRELVTPIKTIDINGINYSTEKLIGSIKGTKILESPKFIYDQRTWKAIDDLIESISNETSNFLKIINLRPRIGETIRGAYIVPSIAFNRNPFKDRISIDSHNIKRVHPPLDKDNFVTFLDNLYSYSSGLVLVPDIRISKIPGIGPTIKPDEYIELISYFAEILSYRNNLPIFVPIQPSISNKSIKYIISNYKQKGYSNIWVNFSAGEVYGKNLAGLRSILRELDSKFGPDNYLVYYTHMKKEISPNIIDVKTPPSDMLSQFLNGDIIGASREPPRIPGKEKTTDDLEKQGFSSMSDYKTAVKLHKNRIFNPSTYYYHKITDFNQKEIEGYNLNELTDRIKNKALNDYIKFNELDNLKHVYETKGEIKSYLKKKDMFLENENIFNEIASQDQNYSLFEF